MPKHSSPVAESTASVAAATATRLVLASASPRRLELLLRVGLTPEVDPADVDESVVDGETAAEYVERVALDKARVVSLRHPDAIVLAADTSVVLGGDVLGKPDDADHALAMLRQLVGRSHTVMTAVVVMSPTPSNGSTDRVTYTTLERATVTMADASEAELHWYVDTGEPLDKAGSFALQGIGAALVERVEGDPTTVIGLPLRATLQALRTAGHQWPSTI